jgi:anaerobic magnesium-protoporphyrin IX monomethyl ester cyclase
MKVLLILAAEPEFKTGSSASYPIPIMSPPLTLLLLDAICRRANHETELIDTRMFMEPSATAWVSQDHLIEEAIAQSNAEAVGISFLSSSAEKSHRIAALAKGYGKTVIGGGLHASVAPHEFVDSRLFHYVVQGEGEEALPALLDEMETGLRPRFPEETVILRAPPIRDLRIVPPVIDYSLYSPVFDQYKDQRSIYVETSRGCFKSCAFCEVAKTGAAWSSLRRMPLETVFKSIEYAVSRHGANYVLIADSIATVFKKHFLSFMSYMTENYPGVTLQFNSTVDCWDEERAQACRQIPCTVWFGFESGSQRVLDNIIQKETKVSEAYRAAELCAHHDIPCAFNVLLGLPGETEEDYAQTIEVFEKCRNVYPNPNIFNPLPGTALYDYCLQRGLLRCPKDYSIWDADLIEQTGNGPVDGVDYGLVLKSYRRLAEMQQEPQRSLSR